MVTIPPDVPPLYWRKSQLLGDAARGIAPLIPVSERTLWRLIRRGQFPAPLRLSQRVWVWNAAEVLQWLATRQSGGR